ncbi:MAG: phytoene desaturase family protein [Bryobacteraceae bacterium]
MQRTAVVIGSGPNGLSAAIHLARNGFLVEVREAAAIPGGGVRSGELTLPGFIHDLGSAVHPMGIASPFFQSLPLGKYGLKWIQPPTPLAHPLDDGTAAFMGRSLDATAAALGEDAAAYRKLYQPLVENWDALAVEILRPLPIIPRHPLLLANFGIKALQPATMLARNTFKGTPARALFAGCAAHSFLNLDAPMTAAFGVIFGATAHAAGWPIPQGGSQAITDALVGVLESYGGRVLTNTHVDTLEELGSPDLILCDVAPRQFVRLAGKRLPESFRRACEEFRRGPGIFKVDWALREPIPWTAKVCSTAGTVHIGGTLEEIAESERAHEAGIVAPRPFVLLAQPTLFDPSRAPDGKHIAWAYCHVPNGWPGSALQQIENQIERFAPGFRDCILARATHGTADMERYDENLIGGDISGGASDLKQFFLRPTWRRYATPLKGVYLCSSSTPPGGGVHGMCGFHAARWALDWLRNRK